MKTLTITKKDLENAQRGFFENHDVSCSCLVYQCLKRNGYDVVHVAYETARLKDNSNLALHNAFPITGKSSYEWAKCVGKKFKVGAAFNP